MTTIIKHNCPSIRLCGKCHEHKLKIRKTTPVFTLCRNNVIQSPFTKIHLASDLNKSIFEIVLVSFDMLELLLPISNLS